MASERDPRKSLKPLAPSDLLTTKRHSPRQERRGLESGRPGVRTGLCAGDACSCVSVLVAGKLGAAWSSLECLRVDVL